MKSESMLVSTTGSVLGKSVSSDELSPRIIVFIAGEQSCVEAAVHSACQLYRGHRVLFVCEPRHELFHRHPGLAWRMADGVLLRRRCQEVRNKRVGNGARQYQDWGGKYRISLQEVMTVTLSFSYGEIRMSRCRFARTLFITNVHKPCGTQCGILGHEE